MTAVCPAQLHAPHRSFEIAIGRLVSRKGAKTEHNNGFWKRTPRHDSKKWIDEATHHVAASLAVVTLLEPIVLGIRLEVRGQSTLDCLHCVW